MENFDIGRFFKIITNNKLYICCIIVLFIAVGYFYSFYYITPMYKSSATIALVQNDALEINKDAITNSDITLNQNLLSTYTKITKNDKVLEQVIKNLKLNISIQKLYNCITVESMNNTEVFKISVSNEDKFLAATITNELVKVFSKEIKTLYNMNNVYIMDIAEVSNTPYNINHVKDIVIFTIIGTLISFGLIVCIYLLDTTIKSEQDIEQYAKLTVLTSIPMYQNKENRKVSELIVNEQPKAPISESFKTFRTNIMFSIKDKELKTILVTSSTMGEGKSFVSSNLAITFAQSGKRVILVDTDMRKGRVHKMFKLMNKYGLSNCLSDIGENGELVNINWYIQKSRIPNLHIMTSGIVPPNPSELLSSPNMKKFLDALKTQYDVIICDGTPCMLVSDSIALSKIVDSTIIVTANKTTKRDALLKVKKSIEIVGGNITGAIINKMEVSAKEYKNGYYYGNGIKSQQLNIEIEEKDEILNNNLYINNNQQEEYIEESYIKNEEINDTKSQTRTPNIDNLTNMITNNTKEVLELKNIYKDVMQNSINTMFKKDRTPFILEEIENIKNLYEENIEVQKDKMSAIDEQIANINFDDKFDEQSNNILEELNNIKQKYEETIKEQNENMIALEEKVANINFDDKFDEQSDNILDELKRVKETYEKALNTQNETIKNLEETLNNNVDNKFNEQSNNIITELNNIKATYENTMKLQKESIKNLEEQITNNVDNKFSEQSNDILEELNNIKITYIDTIEEQNENIKELGKKVLKINFDDKFDEQSNLILEELNNIKNTHKEAIKEQNQNITALEERVSNINFDDKFKEQSNNILNELDNVKETYENAIKEQNQNITALEERVSNINFDDKFKEQSNNILNELDNVKETYENAIKKQNENIQSLEEKVANINLDQKFREQSNNIVEQLNKVKASYEEALNIQNKQIATLDDKISNFNNYEVLAAINGIYKELYGMSERFSYLEKKALENEKLIKDINYNNRTIYEPMASRKIEEKIKNKQDEKVVRLKDYLESTNIANTIDTNTKNARKNSNVTIGEASNIKNNKNKITEVANIESKRSNIATGITNNKIKDTIEAVNNSTKMDIGKEVRKQRIETNNNTIIKPQTVMTSKLKIENSIKETPKTTNKIEFIDYSKIKNKPKRGIFNFNHKQEEEPIAIVSQILCGNKESVG